MRACSGTWVAHGSGSADREVVDRHDRVRVPPDDPSYTLRRVWLSAAEEEGFYYGLSNEGLWPLCHLAYVRPSVSRRGLGGLSGGQSQVRRGRGARGAGGRPGDPDPGLSLRAAARAAAPAPPKGDDRAVLAHPLAQCRDLRSMSLEARDALEPADGGCAGLSHALSLPELPFHRRSLRRVPDRSGAHDRGAAGSPLPRECLSDLDRMAAALAARRARHRYLPARSARSASVSPST